MQERYLVSQVKADLARKMVFLAGPRQVGKTTLAKGLLGAAPGYLNYDVPDDREAILRRKLPSVPLLVLDEIHKYRPWRNYLKGIWDGRREGLRLLVTGSARLDLYRFGGDSLQGRYHLLRMHPLSAAELGLKNSKELSALMTLGGFPEPFYSASETQARRWSREYRTLLLREEIDSLEQVSDLGTLERLMLALPERVGSPLSLNALREDLQVSHKTVARWVAILERLYAIVLLPPFGHAKLRAVKKERKHYHWDWTLIEDPGARFENLIAMHLLKWVQWQQDAQGRDLELCYFRDIDGREVDFVVTEKGKPQIFIEAKMSESDVGKGLRYLKARFPATQAWQLSAEGVSDYQDAEGIRVCPALVFLKGLI